MYTTSDLVDGQGNVVGEVQVTIVGNAVTVTIVVTSNAVLEDVYVYVGTQGVPLNGSGAVDLPAFPFVLHNVNSSSSSYNTMVCGLMPDFSLCFNACSVVHLFVCHGLQ